MSAQSEEGEPKIKGLVLRGGKQGGLYVEDWSIFEPFVDLALCSKCWLCVMYCPEGAITRGEEGPVIDLRFCKGCGICANECPVKAMSMRRK